MKRGCLSLFGLVISIGLVASLAQAKDGSIKNQVEAGFNLQESAALKILQKYPFKGEDRTDYYADIYDGANFLLIPNPEMYKFRLKVTNSKAVLQANTKISILPSVCAEGWAFKVKEKAVGELKLNSGDRDKFTHAVIQQLDALNGPDLTKAVHDVHKLHSQIIALKLPLLDKLLAVPTGDRWYFTASHLTKKVKWTVLKDLGWGNLEISITQGEDYVGSSFIQKKYEIEFQLSDEMSQEHFVHSICEFMKEQGLQPEDLGPVRTKPQAETLKRLGRIRTLLGF
ncbi:MAG: hypothetical protein OM95_04335 [Bdellovibrio sp. ArHS]|uniref:hypothetical protein n=1 Tax=Bdellovibrio sp. ArHS TaxID=1569284 RepID=UPI00058249BB|nr:hypothetical protein [Bdellovibrio sp. ArHS]KHD89274.1 MAG: hypothetical protein OM95_04335 [Bdellovibrio sp. ArHS]